MRLGTVFAFFVYLISNLVLVPWLLWGAFAWRRRAGKVVWGLWWLVGFVSCSGFMEFLLRPLETRFQVPEVEELRDIGVQQVVVLTGGGFPDRGALASSALTQASGARFLAGLELCSLLGEECRLIFSGSAGRGDRNLHTAESMAKVVRRVAPDRAVVAEARSGSTAEHPENIRPLLTGDRFVLITSARHMPRAMTSFRRHGLEPLAYPVDYWTGGEDWKRFLPSQQGLRMLHAAWREYLALVLYGLRGL